MGVQSSLRCFLGAPEVLSVVGRTHFPSRVAGMISIHSALVLAAGNQQLPGLRPQPALQIKAVILFDCDNREPDLALLFLNLSLLVQ